MFKLCRINFTSLYVSGALLSCLLFCMLLRLSYCQCTKNQNLLFEDFYFKVAISGQSQVTGSQFIGYLGMRKFFSPHLLHVGYVLSHGFIRNKTFLHDHTFRDYRDESISCGLVEDHLPILPSTRDVPEFHQGQLKNKNFMSSLCSSAFCIELPLV